MDNNSNIINIITAARFYPSLNKAEITQMSHPVPVHDVCIVTWAGDTEQ